MVSGVPAKQRLNGKYLATPQVAPIAYAMRESVKYRGQEAFEALVETVEASA